MRFILCFMLGAALAIALRKEAPKADFSEKIKIYEFLLVDHEVEINKLKKLLTRCEK